MTRHVADHERSNDGSRLSRYIAISRQDVDEGSHPASKALHARQQTRLAGLKTREFVEIERGRSA